MARFIVHLLYNTHPFRCEADTLTPQGQIIFLLHDGNEVAMFYIDSIDQIVVETDNATPPMPPETESRPEPNPNDRNLTVDL